MGNKGYSVYMHTCPNCKVYIGITSQEPKIRWANGRGYTQSLIRNAIKKYGWENIKHELWLCVEICRGGIDGEKARGEK